MIQVKINSRLLIIGALVVLGLFRECQNNSEINNIRDDYQTVIDYGNKRDSANLAKEMIRAADSVKMTQNIVHYKNISESLKKELEGYKDRASIVEFRSKTVIDSFFIESIVEVYDTLHDSIRVPCLDNRKFFYNFKDDWISLKGNYNARGVLIDTLAIRNEYDVILGWKKEKWYSKRNPTIELKSYSPYSNVDYVNNIVIEDRKKLSLFNSKPAYFIYGALGMFLLYQNQK